MLLECSIWIFSELESFVIFLRISWIFLDKMSGWKLEIWNLTWLRFASWNINLLTWFWKFLILALEFPLSQNIKLHTQIWFFLIHWKIFFKNLNFFWKKAKNYIKSGWLQVRKLKLCLNNVHALQVEPS
jgi:hypothetical protein